MVKQFFYLLLFIVLLQSCNKEFGKLNYQSKLPKVLHEVSGIEFDVSKNAFWMLNDSNNPTEIYLVNSKGKILQTLQINSANKDWEDITKDTFGNIYLGDFGNNSNARKDLHIIKIERKDLDQKRVKNVSKTYFYFPEQKDFPPKKKYYDVEAFFEYHQNFYIFTKSLVKNETGKTKLYKVPNKAGTFAAQLIGDFFIDKKAGSWVTAAAISADGKKVALLNHYSITIFTNFESDDFFSGFVKTIDLEHTSQKESLSFVNDSILFIADERFLLSGGNLYSYKLN